MMIKPRKRKTKSQKMLSGGLGALMIPRRKKPKMTNPNLKLINRPSGGLGALMIPRRKKPKMTYPNLKLINRPSGGLGALMTQKKNKKKWNKK